MFIWRHLRWNGGRNVGRVERGPSSVTHLWNADSRGGRKGEKYGRAVGGKEQGEVNLDQTFDGDEILATVETLRE